jgi:ferric-chelate reductase (NADPH)
MASAKGLILDALLFITRAARVASTRDLGHGVRVITLENRALRDVSWTPGDKIQLVLPTRDVRTFTPSRWANGELELIAFDHGHGPGSVWSRGVTVGDELRFVGPQRSLRRSSRPTVLFGDETSYGLAIAFAGARAPLASIFEVGSDSQVEVVRELGISPAICIVRTPGDGHAGDVADAIARQMRAAPSSELVMSGRAQSIQLVRARLRSLGMTDRPSNKAYWSVGKVGLD